MKNKISVDIRKDHWEDSYNCTESESKYLRENDNSLDFKLRPNWKGTSAQGIQQRQVFGNGKYSDGSDRFLLELIKNKRTSAISRRLDSVTVVYESA